MQVLFNPVHIFIGENALTQLHTLVQKRKYVVVSSNGFQSRGWNNYCPHAEYIIDTVSANPTVRDVAAHVRRMRDIKCDMLVAIGGGSVLDTAKALCVLPDASEKRLLEFIKGTEIPSSKRYDMVAIPTTAGTGAEVTPFATIWDDRKKNKLSLSSKHIFPEYAIIDPVVTLSLDARMTAISGLDALSHCFESLWNKNATYYTRSLAFAASETILETLTKLLHNLNDVEMRMKMCWASMLGGLCISQTKTALAHSMSYPLTSHLGIPHGLASGAFLPDILKYNRQHDKTGIMEEIFSRSSVCRPLEGGFDHLYQILDRLNLFQSIKDNQSAIYSLVPEMIDPTRSLNNIVNTTHDDIQVILDMFFKRVEK